MAAGFRRSGLPAGTAPTPAKEDEELPKIESIGLAEVSKGWVVVLLVTQGERVIAKEILSLSPEPKAHAALRAQTEITKTFVLPRRGVGA